MTKELILTCDIGTSGCKSSVFDENGVEQASVTIGYPTVYPRPNWAEQDMDVLWEAVSKSFRLLTEQVGASNIAVVSLTGTMNGCIPVDGEGKALKNNIIHSDGRAASSLEEIAAAMAGESFYALTGSRLDYHYMLPKILWLRKHEPAIYKQAVRFLNTKDYFHGKLTGNFNVTDYSDASLTVALDIGKRTWAEGLLRELGIPLDKMPVIKCGHDVSDTVTPEAAAVTGLRVGTPVAVGGGDGSCTARGAGLRVQGDAYCYIGSSAWVSQLIDGNLPDKKERVFNYYDMDGESVLTCGAITCGASAFNWALDNFLGERDFGKAEAMAREVAPGSEGVLFLPSLMGERTPYWDSNTRGALVGLSLYHDRRHIARALYEGIAYALFTCADIMRESGKPIKSLMLTGGGAKSGLWPQMLSSLCGVEARIHRNAEQATSLGSAIAAGVGMGMFTSYAEGAAKVGSSASFMPDEKERDAMMRLYPVYASLYGCLKPVFDDIGSLV